MQVDCVAESKRLEDCTLAFGRLTYTQMRMPVRTFSCGNIKWEESA